MALGKFHSWVRCVGQMCWNILLTECRCFHDPASMYCLWATPSSPGMLSFASW
jgi:hypothetical protein